MDFRSRRFWDFFYEHCSLFSSTSLATAFARCGFRLRSVDHVFGGQYLLSEGVRAENVEGATNGADVADKAFAFAERATMLEAQCRERINELAANQRIAVWGAGAKGVTFVNVIDPERRNIDCVVDLNPAKQGTYIAGSGHGVVNYRALRERGVAAAIVMNPNYLDENRRILSEAGMDVRLLVAE